VTPAARALLASLIDYAGLFPPAGLPMADAVAEYARWRRSPEAWMLGRFVVPAARLGELVGALAGIPDGDEPWPLSALVGPDVAGAATRLARFDRESDGRARVDAVELTAATPAEAEAALDALPPGMDAYVELLFGVDPGPLLGVLRARGARAKIRTGGVIPEAVPEPAQVARFIAACADAGVPFKATAGLHHAVRAEHALTYAPDAPRVAMHGFLNVFAAAAVAHAGVATDLEAVLREEDAAAFQLDGEGLAWRELRVLTADLAECRASFAASFGSCSFAEPVADLRALGVIA
jgi:hypothetical protein